jgi:hypothetical protein
MVAEQRRFLKELKSSKEKMKRQEAMTASNSVASLDNLSIVLKWARSQHAGRYR